MGADSRATLADAVEGESCSDDDSLPVTALAFAARSEDAAFFLLQSLS
jgi:hypothetical protein